MRTLDFSRYFSLFCTACCVLFFLLILHFKWSYSLFPILTALVGIGLLIQGVKQKKYNLSREDKLLIVAFVGYFLLFVFSFFIHQGKPNELDLPSRLLLVLPILAVCYRFALNLGWILYGIVIATLIAGIVAVVQFFLLKMPHIFPVHMYIQSGGIILTLSCFSLIAAFFFQQRKMQKWGLISLLAAGLGIFATLLNQSRGPWVVAPLLFALILWFNRHALSKWVLLVVLAIGLIGGGFAGHLVEKRWNQARQEITQYIDHNKGYTSLGARFDMWKSAWLGIQEKPLFGWGLQGVKQMREQHFQQKQIHKVATRFDHAHNQYLHDASARGVLGLIALLAIFLVPLAIFRQNMKGAAKDSYVYLWGQLGIVHSVAIMGYCLSQGFLSHNSGMMFYGFGVILLLGLQKNAKNRPLEYRED